MKEIYTQIQIDAPPERVWAHLVDCGRYERWNPFIRKIEGTLAPGSVLSVYFSKEAGMGMKFTPTVIEFRVEKEFRWLGKLWSERLFSGEHAFLLEESGGGKTLFIQKETFRGILVPVIMGLTGSSTKRGFEEMNKALKHEAET